MPILTKSAGVVTAVWGQAFLLLPNGKVVPVKVGDHVDQGAEILTTQDGIVQISPDEGGVVQLKPNVEPAGEVDRVITALNNNEIDVETAAGLNGGSAGSLEEGLRVERVSESVSGGQLTFDFSTERSGASATDSIRLYSTQAVTPNSAPVLSLTTPTALTEGTATAGQTITTASATDEDGDTLTYSLTAGSDPNGYYSIDATTGVVTLTQAGADLVNAGGDLPAVNVTVSDGQAI